MRNYLIAFLLEATGANRTANTLASEIVQGRPDLADSESDLALLLDAKLTPTFIEMFQHLSDGDLARIRELVLLEPALARYLALSTDAEIIGRAQRAAMHAAQEAVSEIERGDGVGGSLS